MTTKKAVPIGRTKARRIVGVDPKNMTRFQRDTMIGYHMGDIRRAMFAEMYGDIVMLSNRIKLLAELNEKETEVVK
jgi:hypothetical protein